MGHEDIVNSIFKGLSGLYENVLTNVEYYDDDGQPAGEIDLIAEDPDDNSIVVYEVKCHLGNYRKALEQLNRFFDWFGDYCGDVNMYLATKNDRVAIQHTKGWRDRYV